MKHRAATILLGCLCAGVLAAGQGQTRPPTFRAGVDIVHLDVWCSTRTGVPFAA
jgi:hypothetical protein